MLVIRAQRLMTGIRPRMREDCLQIPSKLVAPRLEDVAAGICGCVLLAHRTGAKVATLLLAAIEADFNSAWEPPPCWMSCVPAQAAARVCNLRGLAEQRDGVTTANVARVDRLAQAPRPLEVHSMFSLSHCAPDCASRPAATMVRAVLGVSSHALEAWYAFETRLCRPVSAPIYINERFTTKRELLRARALLSDRIEAPLALVQERAQNLTVGTVAAEVF